MNKIYLASPFFNDEQNKRIDRFKNYIADKNNIELFSPRDDGVVINENSSLKEKQIAFEKNLYQIKVSDLVFAIVDDDDPGTSFEIGYAYSKNIPVCLFSFKKKEKLNLMLSESFNIFVNGNWDLMRNVILYLLNNKDIYPLLELLNKEILVFDGKVE